MTALAEVLTSLTANQRRELAAWFEVPPTTVNRWIRGTARPHPRLVARIIRHVRIFYGRALPLAHVEEDCHVWDAWDWFVHLWTILKADVVLACIAGFACGELSDGRKVQAKATRHLTSKGVYPKDLPVALLSKCANHGLEECDMCGCYLEIDTTGETWNAYVARMQKGKP